MFDSMLRSSDDSAAEVFWNRGGGSAIVSRVAARYGLGGTRPPRNGRWFNTISTAADLVRYYEMMLSGAGGLPQEKADMIVDDLAASAPVGIDGMMPGGVYPQRFGIPEALYAEPVAVEARLDVLRRLRLDAPVHRHHRLRSSLRHGDRVGPAGKRGGGTRDHHPGCQDDVPGRADLASPVLRWTSRRVQRGSARFPAQVLYVKESYAWAAAESGGGDRDRRDRGAARCRLRVAGLRRTAGRGYASGDDRCAAGQDRLGARCSAGRAGCDVRRPRRTHPAGHRRRGEVRSQYLGGRAGPQHRPDRVERRQPGRSRSRPW